MTDELVIVCMSLELTRMWLPNSWLILIVSHEFLTGQDCDMLIQEFLKIKFDLVVVIT